MVGMPDKDAAAKADRALKLYEQGLTRAQLAERLSVNPKNMTWMLQRARQRRQKAGGMNGETFERKVRTPAECPGGQCPPLSHLSRQSLKTSGYPGKINPADAEDREQRHSHAGDRFYQHFARYCPRTSSTQRSAARM
jgi:hypothetical protein